MNRISSLTSQAKLNVAGLLLAATGMLVQIASGSTLYPTLTGPVVLVTGAAVVALRLGRWTSYLGLIVPLVLGIGLAISAVMSPVFLEQVVDIGNATIAGGSALHVVGLLAAVVGGAGTLLRPEGGSSAVAER